MGWNHRVLVTDYKGTLNYSIHEVYYDEKGEPSSSTVNPVSVSSEEMEGLAWSLEKMKECLEKPVIWGDDKFPTVFDDSYRKAYMALERYNRATEAQCTLQEMLERSLKEAVQVEGVQVLPTRLTGEERWEILRDRVGEETFKSWVDELVPFDGGLSHELEYYNIPKHSFEIIHNGESVKIYR